MRGETRTVHPTTQDKEGRWACIRCGQIFANNMQVDTHCMNAPEKGSSAQPGGAKGSKPRAKHVLAWFNVRTGNFEVP